MRSIPVLVKLVFASAASTSVCRVIMRHSNDMILGKGETASRRRVKQINQIINQIAWMHDTGTRLTNAGVFLLGNAQG